MMLARPTPISDKPALLLSPPFTLDGDAQYCLKVQYYMIGSGHGTLQV